MEKQTTKIKSKKNKKTQKFDGTMSFVQHLDELRTHLIRYFVVLVICILASYFFRKEILDIIRKPVDVPLKKYASISSPEVSKTKKVLPALNSYDCTCQEVEPVISVVLENDTSNEEKTDLPSFLPKNTTSDEARVTTAKGKEKIVDLAQWLEMSKKTVNDFFVFFQILFGKEPSPVFGELEQEPNLKQNQSLAARPTMPGIINLNCSCVIDTSVTSQIQSSQTTMVYIGLPELFFAQMKVAIFAGIFISFPFLLIELWSFVGPALYKGEKKVFWIFSISSYFFFIGGALFGYFVVFPFGFDFFLSLTQLGEIMPSLSIGQYLNFAIKLLLAFGLIFELPLVTFILARMGVVTPEVMIKQARMAIVVIFILSAMLTPPDPFTMMLMSGPLILLYLLSIGVCFVGIDRKKAALRAQGLDESDS